MISTILTVICILVVIFSGCMVIKEFIVQKNKFKEYVSNGHPTHRGQHVTWQENDITRRGVVHFLKNDNWVMVSLLLDNDELGPLYLLHGEDLTVERD